MMVCLSTNLNAQWVHLPKYYKTTNASNSVQSMCTNPKGDLFINTWFNGVLKYDSTGWSGLGGSFSKLCSDTLGNIYGTSENSIFKHNGSEWSKLGSEGKPEMGVYCSNSFTDINNNLYVVVNDGFDYSNVLKYDGNKLVQISSFNEITLNSIHSDKSGNLYVGGWLRNSNGNYYIAKYDGTSWSELGGSNSLKANGFINSIYSDKAGNIYVGGSFKNSNGNYYIAKYDGTSWTELGGNNSLKANGFINSIHSDKTGNIYAGGSFKNSNGKCYVAKYDGTSWTELGGNNSLKSNEDVKNIVSDKVGNIYAVADSAYRVVLAKYDGTSWLRIGSPGEIFSLNIDSFGTLYAGGNFRNLNGKNYIAKLIGNNWTEFYQIDTGKTWSIAFDSKNTMYLSGEFKHLGFLNTMYNHIKKYDGVTWSKLGINNILDVLAIRYFCSGKDGVVYACVMDKYVKKQVTSRDGSKYDFYNHFIVRYKDKNWSIVSDTSINMGYEMHIDDSGNLYAFQPTFQTYLSNAAYYLMKFNGTSWSRIGGTADSIYSGIITSDKYGNIYTGGSFKNSDGNLYIAKYDGTSWTELGGKNSFSKLYNIAASSQFKINSIVSDKFGNIYVGGYFLNIGGGDSYVAKYNDTFWSELGGANSLIKQNFNFGGAYLVCSDTFGNIYAGGSLTYLRGSEYVAKFLKAEGSNNNNNNNNNNSLISNSEDSPISIFPNPTSDFISIKLTSNFKKTDYEIYNNLGSIVKTGVIEKSEFKIDLRNMVDGIYFVKIGNDIYRKIIVSK